MGPKETLLNPPRFQKLTWRRCWTISQVCPTHGVCVRLQHLFLQAFTHIAMPSAVRVASGTNFALSTAVEVLLSLCTNLAVVRSKTGEYRAAVQAADDALLLQPDNGAPSPTAFTNSQPHAT